MVVMQLSPHKWAAGPKYLKCDMANTFQIAICSQQLACKVRGSIFLQWMISFKSCTKPQAKKKKKKPTYAMENSLPAVRGYV